ncbi:uncharacterized protein E5676_scaffold349G00010 [Cucumis melo var. makuwa]|uniref:Reverse transcriptase/retrotransposon-derived protein RNase H-like domain-containing protein n=1 Tax=Cucumis melo var. makuwa TaxID=1194695 RepID=A0A5D3E3D6_CUCMM|nr:uncharacterized protein E5676_scaffold349G00010 [Cucumis melo var. makuwa]
MDEDKLRAIKEWKASYFYDRVTFLPLIGTTWRWPVECQTAFDNLKVTITRGPVLGLVDVSKSFIVETDALDFAFGGVLSQKGHPIAYESRKLNSSKRRYTVSEKEMFTMVHCLREGNIYWNHHSW